MPAPARLAALDALLAFRRRRTDLPGALAAMRERLEDERDRALAADLVLGTIRWQAALDHVAARVASRPARAIDPAILDILRLATYELLHHSRVPARAVVHDAVDLTRHVRRTHASGFVNAVLRRLVGVREQPPLPPRPALSGEAQGFREPGPAREAALDYLSITLSHPRWLATRWLDRLGFEPAEHWARFNNSPAPLTLRANRLRTDRDGLARALGDEGVKTRPARWAPDGLIATSGHPLRSAAFEGGAFVVQDEASQLVALLADVRPGMRLLDPCASPGGKATWFAAGVAPGGLVVAADVRPRRVTLLRDTVRRLGATGVRIVQADLGRGLPVGDGAFDRVFVDAPCSGLGTVRRDPDIKWSRTESDLEALAAAQLRMLHEAARAVSPGGLLVYATCSSEPEENDRVVSRFLAEDPRFVMESPAAHRPDLWDGRPMIEGPGWFRTRPDLHDLEAFFGATLRRAG